MISPTKIKGRDERLQDSRAFLQGRAVTYQSLGKGAGIRLHDICGANRCAGLQGLPRHAYLSARMRCCSRWGSIPVVHVNKWYVSSVELCFLLHVSALSFHLLLSYVVCMWYVSCYFQALFFGSRRGVWRSLNALLMYVCCRVDKNIGCTKQNESVHAATTDSRDQFV